MVSAGIAALLPRHGLGVAYAYLLGLDGSVAAMPFSIANLSITHHVLVVAGVGHGTPSGSTGAAVLWLLAIGSAWLVIALVRVSRSEFSSSDT
jgi:hypothetical protein